MDGISPNFGWRCSWWYRWIDQILKVVGQTQSQGHSEVKYIWVIFLYIFSFELFEFRLIFGRSTADIVRFTNSFTYLLTYL